MAVHNDHVPEAHPTADASTLAVFQDTWTVYRKVVDNNYLCHREAYAALHSALSKPGQPPFRFLDIACGDASASIGALRGTAISHYRGMDFSTEALRLAASSLAELGCAVELENGDFLDLVPKRRNMADVVWMGLSLHHLKTADKLAFMREVQEGLRSGATFLIYENSLRDDEDREGWLRRWDLQRPTWTGFSDAEWSTITDHVHAADYPESTATWYQLGKAAGFRTSTKLVTTPTDLFSVYRFDA